MLVRSLHTPIRTQVAVSDTEFDFSYLWRYDHFKSSFHFDHELTKRQSFERTGHFRGMQK